MKLVIHFKGYAVSIRVLEKDINTILDYLRNTYPGETLKPLPGELYRKKIPKGAIVLYRKNRRMRTRSEWLEIRGLMALSEELGLDFIHSVQFSIDGIQREVDGVNIEEGIMVEVHWKTLDREWLNYYYKKMKYLGFRRCIIVARDFEDGLNMPGEMEAYRLELDMSSSIKYYTEVSFPGSIRDLLGKRHIRVLTNKGTWVGFIRRLSRTSRYTPEEKFRIEIERILRRNFYPIKIYYSQARMVNPTAEFRGKGHPLPILIGVLDIDAEGIHLISNKNYVSRIKKWVKAKIDPTLEILREMGYRTQMLFSGKKGFHIYFWDNHIEHPLREIETILQRVAPYVDNINFRNKDNQYDLHRIIKLPHTIDQTTGYTISTNPKKIPRDKIIRYTP